VDLDVLEREAGRVLRARVAHEATRLRAGDPAEVSEPNVDVRARHEIARRTLQIMTGAPADIVRFELHASCGSCLAALEERFTRQWRVADLGWES
jgi:hypothetical protein